MGNPFVLEKDTLSEKIQIRLTPSMHEWLESEAKRKVSAGHGYGTNVTDLVRWACAKYSSMPQRERDKPLE